MPFGKVFVEGLVKTKRWLLAENVADQDAHIQLALRGRCNVCGRKARFFFTDPLLYRESLFCSVCKTNSRYRSVARGILRAVNELAGLQAQSLAELRHSRPGKSLTVYDTQLPFYYSDCAYPIPDLLLRCRWINTYLSSYREHHALGLQLAPHTSNQNLEKLTFPDNHFDVVITSDVMEHVRLDFEAHREIARVLKPGGVYLFTVPHYRDARETVFRVAVNDPLDSSTDQFLMEKEYHGDANSADHTALSYRVYGTDLDHALTQLGFTVDYTRQDFPETGIMSTELFYCRLTSKVDAVEEIH